MTKDILTTIVPIKMPGHLPGHFDKKIGSLILYIGLPRIIVLCCYKSVKLPIAGVVQL